MSQPVARGNDRPGHHGVGDVVEPGSRVLELRGPMMVKGRYVPATMKLGVWQKDMRAIDEFARSLGCPTPLFTASTPIYAAAVAMGREVEDTAAVCAVLERQAGHRRIARNGRKGS